MDEKKLVELFIIEGMYAGDSIRSDSNDFGTFFTGMYEVILSYGRNKGP